MFIFRALIEPRRTLGTERTLAYIWMEPAAFSMRERNAGVIHAQVLLEPSTYLFPHIKTNAYIGLSMVGEYHG